MSVKRLTVSLLNGRKIGTQGQWASSFVWGANAHDDAQMSHSVLLESQAILNARNSIFGRAEIVQKGAHELGLADTASHAEPEPRFSVGHVSLGYLREVVRVRGATFGLGVRGTLNIVPSGLETAYGSRMPLGVVLFARLRPAFEPAMASPAHQHPD
jgi:hypothetical protein